MSQYEKYEMNQNDPKLYFEQIMQRKGIEDLQKIVRKWQALSDNMSEHPSNLPVLLPDMLWFSRSGSGRSSLLGLLAEYLHALKNLMPFYGDVKYFEFLLSYCPPERPFTELYRLIDEVTNAAGFRNEYKGIIFIDIDEWRDHFEERHFVSFMEYLAGNSDEWMIILSVNANDCEDFHELEAFLSMFLRIEKISITSPEPEDLFEYLERNLQSYGLRLSEDAKELLLGSIEKLRSNKYFDGYKSIRMLYQDIVYTVFSEAKADLLTAGMLANFSADSEYIRRMFTNIRRVHKIGFAG